MKQEHEGFIYYCLTTTSLHYHIDQTRSVFLLKQVTAMIYEEFSVYTEVLEFKLIIYRAKQQALIQ